MELKEQREYNEGQLTQRKERVTELERELINEQLEREKQVAVLQQDKDYYRKRVEDHEQYFKEQMKTAEETSRKLRDEHTQKMEEVEARKDQQLAVLEDKYHQLKNSIREQEQKSQQTVLNLENQVAREQERAIAAQQKYQELEASRPAISESVLNELAQVKLKLAHANKSFEEETGRLRRELGMSEQQRQQLANETEKERLLMQDKLLYVEQHKEKIMREGEDNKRKMEEALDSLQACRSKDKQYYEIVHRDQVTNIEKKYSAVLREMQEAHKKEIHERQISQRELQTEVRRLTEELAVEGQTKNDVIRNYERKVREAQEREERAMRELDNYKANREMEAVEEVSKLQRENEKVRSKLQQKEEKIKQLEKVKQDQFYEI